MKTIGKKIKQLRRDKGLSQNELAEVLGVTGQAVSKWESDTSQPDIGLLPDLAAYFGVAIDDLFEYSKDKTFYYNYTSKSITKNSRNLKRCFSLTQCQLSSISLRKTNLNTNI